MNTLSVNLTHDASLTLMRDGNIILHQVEERIAHKKFAQDLYYSFDKLEEYFDSIEKAVDFIANGCETAVLCNKPCVVS